MDLGAAHEELGIERGTGDERRPLAAADHVRADERLADQAGADHVRHDAPQRLVGVRLVVQAHDHGHLLHAPEVADLAERVLERVRGIAVVERAAGGLRVGRVAVVEQVGGEVRAVELEAVHAVVAREAVQRLREPGVRVRMREVEERGDAVPPEARLRVDAAVDGEEAALPRIAPHVVRVDAPRDAAEGRQVHAHVRAHPQHDLVAHAVEPVHHPLRVPETGRLEAPVAVAGLPGVVDHQHAGRHAVVQHGLRVGEDVLLVLVVGQLDPGVDLGRAEEERVGHLPARGEPRAHRVAVRLGERRAALLDDDVGGGLDRDFAVLQRELRLGVRPHHAPPVRQQEGRALVVVVVPPEVDFQIRLRRERHLRAEEVRGAPPVLAGSHLHGGRARENRAREARRQQKKSVSHPFTFAHSHIFTFPRSCIPTPAAPADRAARSRGPWRG